VVARLVSPSVAGRKCEHSKVQNLILQNLPQ
jgi:hypothetical protein